MKILYFTANPEVVKMPSEPGFSDKPTNDYADYTKLDLWPELKEVANVFYEARMDGDVHLEVVPEARAEDVVRYVERFRPDIVHFSGHGEKKRLVVSDSAYFDGETLAAQWLKQTLQDKGVSVLVLNCCWSASFVEDLKDTVGLVIGADQPLRVENAQKFAALFYGAVRDGLPLGEAYVKAATVSEQYKAEPKSGPVWEQPFSAEPLDDAVVTRLIDQRAELVGMKAQLTGELMLDSIKVLIGLSIAIVAVLFFRDALPLDAVWELFDHDKSIAAAWKKQEWMAAEPFAIFFILMHKPIARLISFAWGRASLSLAIKTVDFSMLSHHWAKKHQVEARLKGLINSVRETARG